MAALGLKRVRETRGRPIRELVLNRGRPRRAAPTVRSEGLLDDFEFEGEFLAAKNCREIELPKFSCEAQ